MTGWTDDREAIEDQFDSRPPERVNLLVCADGVGSTARSRLLPAVRPVCLGYVAWRGTVPEASLERTTLRVFDDAITYCVYANSHILVYPIPGPDGSIEPVDRLINFVWYRNYLEGGDLDDLLTDSAGRRHGVSPDFRPSRTSRVNHTAHGLGPGLRFCGTGFVPDSSRDSGRS